jgi:transposase InsO family protein
MGIKKRGFIHRNRQLFHTSKEGCRLMDIKRSTFYYQKKVNIPKIQQEISLKEKIQQITCQHPYYGYRRITAQLHRENININHKRVLRMMRELGIQARIKRKYVTTTNSRHNNTIYPNLIKDKVVTGINQVWCSDITYISILFGFVYLAVIIDIYSRKIVGYAIGKTLSPQLAITALKMAIANRNTDRLIHHSDQGIQYTCKEYIKILKDNGIRISMSAKGNPYDNAYAESLIKTLKQEEVYLWQYETFSDVGQKAIAEQPLWVYNITKPYWKKD